MHQQKGKIGFTAGNFDALPTASKIPSGNPATTATDASNTFSKKPPHKFGFGPPPIISMRKIIGIIKIQKIIRNCLEIFRYSVGRINFLNKK